MVDIFVEKHPEAKPTFDMGVLFNRKNAEGELGLEIEIEGYRLPHEDETPAPWLYKADGSLRGRDNGEYVLAKPIKFDDLPGALDKLWAKFGEFKTEFDDSNRTSVHVHLNCQRFHLNRLTSFMALYFCFEDLLAHWCGEHRVGNLFTLRAKDAPAIVTSIKRFLRADGQGKYYLHDNLHYSGLAVDALPRFGSLEVRLMGGTSDPKAILDWVEMLRRLYDLSREFRDPREIVERFSEMGPMQFFLEMMGPQVDTLRKGLPNHTDQNIRSAMMEGIRLAQDLCYCRDWSKDKEVLLKADPFGRDVKKMLNKIMAVGDMPQPAPAMGIAALINEGPFGAPPMAPPMPEPEGHFDDHEQEGPDDEWAILDI